MLKTLGVNQDFKCQSPYPCRLGEGSRHSTNTAHFHPTSLGPLLSLKVTASHQLGGNIVYRNIYQLHYSINHEVTHIPCCRPPGHSLGDKRQSYWFPTTATTTKHCDIPSIISKQLLHIQRCRVGFRFG